MRKLLAFEIIPKTTEFTKELSALFVSLCEKLNNEKSNIVKIHRKNLPGIPKQRNFKLCKPRVLKISIASNAQPR